MTENVSVEDTLNHHPVILGISKIVYAVVNERFGGICSVGNCNKYNSSKPAVEVVRCLITTSELIKHFDVVEDCRRHVRGPVDFSPEVILRQTKSICS